MRPASARAGANLPLSSSLINYAHMVWTISLEEFLINGSILQGSKDLRLSNVIVKSENNSIRIIPRWSSFRSPSSQKTHQRIPVSNWNCCCHVPKKKKTL
ncbi:hypothetical protein TNCV_3240711 [Trichonephila clavipes]|nr:hypothetical protein TNCV_3240711 [Trichonephila clavipes]